MRELIAGALALLLLCTVAEARHRHGHAHHHRIAPSCPGTTYDNDGRIHYCPPSPTEGRTGVRHRAYVRHVRTRNIAQAPHGFGRVCTKEGHCSTVAGYLVGKFQGLIHDFEELGYNVGIIGCLSPGHMAHSLHHTGRACDLFSQSARGRLPIRHPPDDVMNRVAERHGLTSGASWCDNDRGHFDVSGYNGCHRAHRRHYAKNL